LSSAPTFGATQTPAAAFGGEIYEPGVNVEVHHMQE
jgi:hypothetical protein